MLYRVVRSIHRGYALTILWAYVGLFGLAFCFMFMFPPATLALVFAGIFGLAAAYVGEFMLGITENSLARGFLRRSTCPRCRGAVTGSVATGPRDSTRTTCPACGTVFERNGAEVDPDELASSPPIAL